MNTENKARYHIREAQSDDIQQIIDLFADEVEAGRMLPRSYDVIRDHIQDWRVAVDGNSVIGCVSLEFYNPQLCEVRSLAVSEEFRKNGLGKKLVTAAVELAEERAVRQVLTLTRAPVLFEKAGFSRDLIDNFPEKVRKDCAPCPFFHCCDEIALVMEMEVFKSNK